VEELECVSQTALVLVGLLVAVREGEDPVEGV
jgi:hypothetical protein